MHLLKIAALKEAQLNEPRIREVTDEEAKQFEEKKKLNNSSGGDEGKCFSSGIYLSLLHSDHCKNLEFYSGIHTYCTSKVPLCKKLVIRDEE